MVDSVAVTVTVDAVVVKDDDDDDDDDHDDDDEYEDDEEDSCSDFLSSHRPLTNGGPIKPKISSAICPSKLPCRPGWGTTIQDLT